LAVPNATTALNCYDSQARTQTRMIASH